MTSDVLILCTHNSARGVLAEAMLDHHAPRPSSAIENGLLLLAAVPCTAMVFVWSRLTGGHPLFTLSQVALNDTIMVFAFALIVALLLGLLAISVPWDTLITSVVLYILVPVVIAQVWRRALLRSGQAAFDIALAKIGPWSITALLATLVLLFAFQGEAFLKQPLATVVGVLIEVPVMLLVVRIVNRSKPWYERGRGVA